MEPKADINPGPHNNQCGSETPVKTEPEVNFYNNSPPHSSPFRKSNFDPLHRPLLRTEVG